MAFKPTGQITLCKVDFDNSYKNVRYFENMTHQRAWFLGLETKRTFTDYLFVRKVKDDGTLKSSIKVNENIDSLYEFNYLHYYNNNVGTNSFGLYFYCFITDLIYINESTTEVVFETDVYQTWMLKCELKESFVEREHSDPATEAEAFPNVIPEPFNVNEFEYYEIESFDSDYPSFKFFESDFGYLLITSDAIFESSNENVQSGLYQGLRFYFFNTYKLLSTKVESFNKDIIMSITPIPKFTLVGCTIRTPPPEDLEGDIWDSDGEYAPSSFDNDRVWGEIVSNTEPREYSFDLLIGAEEETFRFFPSNFGDYVPLNKKLYAPQFRRLAISNGAGDVAEYDLSQFGNNTFASFTLYGDISCAPSMSIVPYSYKGVLNNADESISLSGFPQSSFASDTYKIWLAQNSGTLAIKTGASIVGLVTGAIAMMTPVTAWMGAGMALSGVNGILNVINDQYKASMMPNVGRVGNPANNLLTVIGENRFRFFIKHVREEYAKQIDDFMTMYGYQVNEVKIPNVNLRPCWNYVKTNGVNILPNTISVPNRDMIRLKQIFDDGVTLWKKGIQVGDYNNDNLGLTYG